MEVREMKIREIEFPIFLTEFHTFSINACSIQIHLMWPALFSPLEKYKQWTSSCHCPYSRTCSTEPRLIIYLNTTLNTLNTFNRIYPRQLLINMKFGALFVLATLGLVSALPPSEVQHLAPRSTPCDDQQILAGLGLCGFGSCCTISGGCDVSAGV